MRVAVVGGGIAGLTTAWELARAGVQVDLYEASPRLGGSIAPVQLAGVSVDAGAEAFATRTPAVREFLAELGLAEQIVSPNPAGAWLQLPEFAAPLPATGILGIPGEPEAADVARILGAEQAARPAQDLTAAMTWTASQRPSLGEVVADRMGAAVVERLVAPITSGVHSADPYSLPISTAHPKLYATMLAEGSLARAVSVLRAAAPAGSAVQSLRGGMNTLITALETQLRELGARIHLNAPVFPAHSSDAEVVSRNWRYSADFRRIPSVSRHKFGKGEHDAVVLAVAAAQAAALAADHPGPDTAVPEAPQQQAGSGVALVTLLVRAPELDAHPRGTGMLVAPSVQGIGAKAMTHISAKWAWAAQTVQDRLGPGHHILRLSYGRSGDETAAPLGYRSTDQDLCRAALADLPQLTGVQIIAEQVLDHTVVRWWRGGADPQAHQLRHRLSAPASAGDPQFALAGESFAGTGLAQIIPDAREAARQLLGEGSSGNRASS